MKTTPPHPQKCVKACRWGLICQNVLQQRLRRWSSAWWPSGWWGCSSWSSARGSSGTRRRGSTSISCSSRHSRSPEGGRGGREVSGRAFCPPRGGGGVGTEGQTHRDVVTLSDVGAQDAGDHAAEVQQGHAAAPAVVRGRLALQAGEAEQPAATCGGGRNASISWPKQSSAHRPTLGLVVKWLRGWFRWLKYNKGQWKVKARGGGAAATATTWTSSTRLPPWRKCEAFKHFQVKHGRYPPEILSSASRARTWTQNNPIMGLKRVTCGLWFSVFLQLGFIAPRNSVATQCDAN